MMSFTITQNQTLIRRKQICTLCILTVLLLIPFINKPLHIDDPLYVWTARQIRAHPLDFHGFHLNWQGHDQAVSQFFENPPFTSYLLATVSFVAGLNRVAFHLSFLIFNLLSVIGMYLLAGQFCRRPLLAAVLLLLCPAFLVSATTLMCEPLLICFWIWATYLWIAGTRRGGRFLFLAGGVALVAVLTKFMAICIVPLLILQAACTPASIRTRWMQAIALMIPVFGAIGYELFTIHHYGIGGFSGAAAYVAGSHKQIGAPLAAKLLNTFCFVGGCTAVCVAMLPLIFPRWISVICVLIGAVLTGIAAAHFLPPGGWVPSLSSGIIFYGQTMIWLVGGSAIAVISITRLSHAIRRKLWQDELFLFTWAAGIFFFTAFINWSINARSILPMLPPICILIARSLDAVPKLPRFSTGFLLIFSAVLAEAVTASDYQLAAIIKKSAEQIPQIAQAYVPPGRPLWFTGHWGFQYYIEQTGARAIDDLAPQFKPGDIVVYPAGAYGGTPGGGGYIHLRRVEIGAPRWVATTQVQLGGAFYCSYGYGLPFIFASIPPEPFDIVQVTSQTRIHP